MLQENSQKTVLLNKAHGNHQAENANLTLNGYYENYKQAVAARDKEIFNRFQETSTSSTYEEFHDEEINYYAIYSEGDNNYVDRNFFNLD